MGSQNSLVDEFYIDVYERLHSDVAGAFASVSKVEYQRDLAVMRRRVDSEGLSFFTKTLPRLGKALDRALSLGDKLQFTSFSKKKGTELPAYCGWLFSYIFDSGGRERSDACPKALRLLRQLLFCFYKLELPYDEVTVNQTVENFISNDESLTFNGQALLGIEAIIAKRARHLVCRVMSSLCPKDINPRHGPGNVATGEESWQKRFFKRIYSTAEGVYPFTEYFFYNLTHVCDRYAMLDSFEVLDAGTAKVALVPKDSRGPRLISCEPLELQWLQQGQMSVIVPHLESHWLTRGHVSFTDQTVNQQLAMSASLTGKLATLDMKDASDRVSWELVDYLFPAHWADALYATRSARTKLPDGRVLILNKFAPMGSAVCFPVEALIFWALCVSIVSCTRNVPLSEARHTIYVYGDDIICSSEDQAAIRQYLPSFDLVVNESKCCVGRNFKESCGVDAYKGVVVTPTKFRSTWSSSLDVESYQSWVDYSNRLWKDGYYACSEYIEQRIQKIRRTPYFSKDSHAGIGFVRDYITPHCKNQEIGLLRRFNTDFQRTEVLGWVSKPRNKFAAGSDWEELLRIKTTSQNFLNPERILYQQRCPVNYWDLCFGEFLKDSREPVRAQHYALRRSNRLQRCWIAEV